MIVIANNLLGRFNDKETPKLFLHIPENFKSRVIRGQIMIFTHGIEIIYIHVASFFKKRVSRSIKVTQGKKSRKNVKLIFSKCRQIIHQNEALIGNYSKFYFQGHSRSS